MSDAFQDRENTFEKQFAHDEDLRYRPSRAAAQRLALWVPDEGLSGLTPKVRQRVRRRADQRKRDDVGALKADRGSGSISQITVRKDGRR